MFVREGATEPRPIPSMPGVVQHTHDSLRKAVVEAVQAGVGGLMLFAVPEHKDASGSGAVDPAGALNTALRTVRDEVGDTTVVMADLCLDEFTDHGHCGVIGDNGRVDNDATLEIYREMAVAQASAGAHVVGPSGRMDGQVRSEEHTSELQSRGHLVCRPLLEQRHACRRGTPTPRRDD